MIWIWIRANASVSCATWSGFPSSVSDEKVSGAKRSSEMVNVIRCLN